MTIWIVPIEPIDQRYTKQWLADIPKILNAEIECTGSNQNVVTIEGQQVADGTTTGAFLDFGKTNFSLCVSAPLRLIFNIRTKRLFDAEEESGDFYRSKTDSKIKNLIC